MQWTNVSDGLPPVSDSLMGSSDDVLCQDGNGNIFTGCFRKDPEGIGEPYWTHSGRDMYILDDIVRWISLEDVSQILEGVSEQAGLRFDTTDSSSESANSILSRLEGTRNLANNEIYHEELLRLSRSGVIGDNIQEAMDMISKLSAGKEERHTTLLLAAVEAVEHVAQANWSGRERAAKRYLRLVAQGNPDDKSLEWVQAEINTE